MSIQLPSPIYCSPEYLQKELNNKGPNINKIAFRLNKMAVVYIKEGKCPLCTQPIIISELKTNEKAIREWGISGICFKCQTNIFNN